jgi:D-aminoacyl-tRNA deacylase
MRALLQRVSEARVTVAGETVGAIGPGLCILVGATEGEDESTARELARKAWHLRIFDDEDGVMNLALAETHRAALVVSQFTLYADTSAGRRPSWRFAAKPEVAEPLVAAFAAALEELGATVATGQFQAQMDVSLTNHGPVTLMLEN